MTSSPDFHAHPSPASSVVPYRGRFAPSPTGALHFGSLVSALASFLDARHHGGQWLLRIEDLDPPREQGGAIKAIIDCLEAHHLYWDGDILYQSRRLQAYTETVSQLQRSGLIYPCYCTRKTLPPGGAYPGTCRNLAPSKKPAALRLLSSELPKKFSHLHLSNQFDDIFFGHCQSENNLGDFIVRRKDGLFAYQLAVVVDDAYQGISHIIRGADLIDSTPAQRFLFQVLAAKVPQFGHISMALNHLGQKLSKQHGAPPLSVSNSRDNLRAALRFLNHSPSVDLDEANNDELLSWAIKCWDRTKVPTTDAVATLT